MKKYKCMAYKTCTAKEPCEVIVWAGCQPEHCLVNSMCVHWIEKPPYKEVTNVCPKCGGKWRGDGAHQNEFCADCFTSKPGNAEL